MTGLDIAQQRLLNQGIAQAWFEKPADVVSWLCATHAQDFTGAKWALGQRMRAATDSDFVMGSPIPPTGAQKKWTWLKGIFNPQPPVGPAPARRRCSRAIEASGGQSTPPPAEPPPHR